jgi:hypothetical protein
MNGGAKYSLVASYALMNMELRKLLLENQEIAKTLFAAFLRSTTETYDKVSGAARKRHIKHA